MADFQIPRDFWYKPEPIDSLQEKIEQIESELKIFLPKLYKELLEVSNGGDTNYQHSENFSSIIESFCGIHELLEQKEFLITEFEELEEGFIPFGYDISGHCLFLWDYRNTDNNPAVYFLDGECGYNHSTGRFEAEFICDNFEVFIRSLRTERWLEEQKIKETKAFVEQLKVELIKLKFHPELQQLFFNPIHESLLKVLLSELVEEHQGFTIIDDEISFLLFDFVFYLYCTKTNECLN